MTLIILRIIKNSRKDNNISTINYIIKSKDHEVLKSMLGLLQMGLNLSIVPYSASNVSLSKKKLKSYFLILAYNCIESFVS